MTCFLVVGCGPPVREEIIERHLNGEKLLVVAYEGTGSDEKAIRRDYYFDNGNLRQSDHDSTFVQFYNDGTLLYKRVGQREYGFSELNNFWGDSTIVLSDPTSVYHHQYGDWVELIMGISEMDVPSAILQDSTLFTA